MGTAVLALSVVVQTLAAFAAMRLVVVTRFPVAWGLISAALILMGVRRAITLVRVLTEETAFAPDLAAELVALSISALMLCGVLWIGPLLRGIDRTNRALQSRQAELQAYAEASSDYFWATDEKHRASYFSEEFERITGIAVERLVGVDRADITPSDVDREAWLAHLEDFEKRRPFRDFAFQHIRTDGSTVSLSISGVPIFDDRGVFQGYRGVGRDVTPLVKAQNERREQATFLNSIVENMPAMVFVKDAADLRFTLLNRTGEELLGVRREDYIGKTDHDIFPREEAEHFTWVDRQTLAQDDSMDVQEERITSLTGETRFLRTKKIAIRDREGTPRYLLGISEDITERKAAEEMLARSLEEANRANQAKSEFLAKMSHELRTPLNAIIGYSEMIAEEMAGPEVSPRYKRYAGHVRESGRSLLALVNDLLDLSRIEAARLDLFEEVFDYVKLIDGCLVESGSQNERGQGPTLVRDFDHRSLMIRGDPLKLRQAIGNLISNAVKFTDDTGTVTVRLRVDGEGVNVLVEDSGEGIRRDDLPHVFEPFHKGNPDIRSNRQGVGLGLNIARSLVVLHQGRLEIESQLGEGTLVTLWLPADRLVSD